MKKEKVKSIVDDKVNEALKLFEKVNKDFDKKSILQFRIAVKNLRAFLRLINLQTGNPASNAKKDSPALKIPKKFRELYCIAGEIYEAIVELEQFPANKGEVATYIKMRQDYLKGQKEEWGKYPAKKMIYKVKRRFIDLDHELLPETLLYFFIGRLYTIEEICKLEIVTDGRVHDIRKQLRDILYTWKTAKKEWASAHGRLSEIPVKEIKILSNIIGKYNDRRLTLERYYYYKESLTNDDEIQNMNKLCENIANSLDRNRESVLRMTRGLIQEIKQGLKSKRPPAP